MSYYTISINFLPIVYHWFIGSYTSSWNIPYGLDASDMMFWFLECPFMDLWRPLNLALCSINWPQPLNIKVPRQTPTELWGPTIIDWWHSIKLESFNNIRVYGIVLIIAYLDIGSQWTKELIWNCVCYWL